MAPDNATQRITLLSFRTFGDYVLKAPFLHELYRLYPNAGVTLLTNHKGGEVYPLLDSRLKVVVIDHGDSKARIVNKLLRIPKADVVYAVDDSRTTLVLALLVRGKRKTGWIQGISRLYSKDGYFEWRSVQPKLSSTVRMVFRPGRIRLPEDKYEGDVELELLGLAGNGRALAEYRSRFALPPGGRAKTPYIYCAGEAGWTARQLAAEQWKSIVTGLLRAFPGHSIVVHGAAALAELEESERVVPYAGKSIRQLFEQISAADLVIAPDSLALHVASLYNVPAIGYFGPAHPHRFRPTGPGSSSLFRQPECSPCLQMRGGDLCAKGLTQCISLKQLEPADFIASAKTALELPHSSQNRA
jgi:ADP-heptose:LPS heptosyltransferase